MIPGICGWFGRIDGSAAECMQRMLGSAPDPVSSCAGEGAGLSVDAAYEGGGVFSDGRIAAAIAGEPTWSDPALAQSASRNGHGAALAEAFRAHGTELFRFLHGPFALAVHDLQTAESLLAIDRFGIHSLCYAELAGLLAFGSTADSVRGHPAVRCTVDPQAIFNYINFSVVPAPGTIYREQKKLLPAQYLHRAKGTSRTGFYWHMPYRAPDGRDAQALGAEMRRLLEQAVRRAVGSDMASIGAFLSGGLDSSTVAGLLAGLGEAPARTFTMCFGAEGYDEVHYARIAAKRFGFRAHEHNLTPEEAIGALDTLAQAYDEPFGNSSAIPTFRCARVARENGISILLAGDGGDELFGGNVRYRKQLLLDRYFRIPALVRRGLLEPVLGALPEPLLVGPVRKARNYVRLAATPMPDRMLAYEHLERAEAEAMFRPDFLRAIDPRQPVMIARDAYARARSEDALQRMMHLDLELTLADNDLRKVRRMCRAAGVKVRFPFLDEEVVVFSAQLPVELLMEDMRLRGFYKKAMKGFLPDEILDKSKHGFGMPYDLWIRSDPRVRQIVVDNVAAFRRRAYCNPAYIDDLLARYASDDPRCAGRLWDIMILEMWLRARALS